MTPFETVVERFSFPERITPHPLQVNAINDLAPRNDSAALLDMGTGKTFVATACALFGKITEGNQNIVIMPPILLTQWARWLAEITPSLNVTVYRGTPKQREKLSLDADFILVGVQIFKKDYERFVQHFEGRKYGVYIDEATIVGNIQSDNHQKVFEFSIGHPRQLLTGTPMNSVTDAYGLLKFYAPGLYRNYSAFLNLHVAEWDFYKKPIKFQNLDMLADNMKVNSQRILFEDMFPATEEPLYVPMEYDLEPAHYKLYKQLADEELLKLPDGGKVDATSANKLLHALGQIIVNWAHFSQEPDNTSATVAMIEQKLSELGEGKLVVFAKYKLTIRHLTERLGAYGAVAINSEVTEKQKDKNLLQFMSDPNCRVIVIQFVSGGKGLDGLQHVAHHCFFAEPCEQPRDFHQCVARLKRLGQLRRVVVMMGIANRTLQVRGFRNLLKNDTLVNQVIRNATELKDAIYGS